MSRNQKFLIFLQTSNNPLLMKDEIGKAKPSSRTLPANSHTFGYRPKDDKETVGTLLNIWQPHKSSKLPKSDKDYKKLNVLSLAEKACTPADQYKFRKTTDLRLKTAQSKGRDLVPDIVHGVENRPSTPMKAVLSNFYGEYAAENMDFDGLNREVKRNLPPSRSTKGFDRRNEAIRASIQSSPKTIYKNKKYENVQCKTDTGRYKN